MKTVRSHLRKLLAEKEQAQGRNISLRSVASDTGVALTTVMGLANNKLRRVNLDDLQTLCEFLGCDIGDLLKIEDVPNT
jgi:putative transcriptional regulator